MAEVASAYVSLLPSARGFGRQTSAQIDPQLEAAGKSGGKRFGSAFGRVLGPAMGVLAVGAVAGLLKGSIDEAREAQKVGAQTAQVIKTTGGAAKVSAKEIGSLSTALSLKTGVDDEAIQSGANLLLTFKNIKREGAGVDDVFGRATTAALDLSKAGFGDLSGTSKQLGKALNDPVKGVSALNRVGVQFTDEQKKQIKTMVANNDLLGAQKIILKEVESQVGGSAAAQATAGEKMRVAISNLKEEIGTALLPVVDKMANFITTKVVPALTTTVDFLKANPGVVYGFAAAVGVLAAAFIIATAPISLTVLAIAALVAGLVWAYTESETFRTIVNAVFKFVVAYVKVQVAIISAVLRGLWAAISAAIGFFRSLWTNVRDFVGKVVTKVGEIKDKVTGAFKGAKNWLVNVGKDIIQGLINGIKDKFNDVKNTLGDLTGKLTSWKGPESLDKVILRSSGQLVIDGFITGLESRYPSVQTSLSDLTSGLATGVKIPASARFDSANASGAAAGVPDAMPIVDGSQIIGYLRGIASGQARIEIDAANEFETTIGRM